MAIRGGLRGRWFLLLPVFRLEIFFFRYIFGCLRPNLGIYIYAKAGYMNKFTDRLLFLNLQAYYSTLYSVHLTLPQLAS